MDPDDLFWRTLLNPENSFMRCRREIKRLRKELKTREAEFKVLRDRMLRDLNLDETESENVEQP